MNYQYLLIAISTASLMACAIPPTTTAQQKAVIAGPNDANAKSFLLTQVVTQVPLGSRVLNIQYGWSCFTGNSVDWRGGRINLTDDEFKDAFRKEFTQSNYKVAGDPKALFVDKTVANAELLVAGAIEKYESNLCFPFSGSPNADIGITGKLKGSTYLQVRWQVFSTASGKVVFETTTDGSFNAPEITSGSVPEFLKKAFEANVRNLLAEQRLYELAKPGKDAANASPI